MGEHGQDVPDETASGEAGPGDPAGATPPAALNQAHTIVALVLAVGVAGAVLALAIAVSIAEASTHLNVSEATATLLSTTLGAAIGAVATFLGTRQK